MSRFLEIKIVISDEPVRGLLRVVSRVVQKDSLCQGQNTAGCVVNEIPVMGYIQHSAFIGIEGVLEHFLGDEIEMVRRLVEDQEVGFGEHEFGEGHPAFLAAAQIPDPLEDFFAGKEE